jgi:hypothetical protein
MFTAAGLPSANLSPAQQKLPLVSRVTLAGSFVGIILGCSLGLLNLLFIDTNRSATLKLQSFHEDYEFNYTVEASNQMRQGVTALIVKGPDMDGLLASLTSTLAVRGCSLVEMHAKRSHSNLQMDNDGFDRNDRMIEDVFYVVRRDTGEPFDDDDLEDLAHGVLEATRSPMNITTFKAAMQELENTVTYLRGRIRKLEHAMHQRQIRVVSSDGQDRQPGDGTISSSTVTTSTSIADKR